MSNVTFSLDTHKVTGVDRSPLPYEGEVKLPFELEGFTKHVQNVEGKKQKVDADGNPLYMDNIVLDSEGNVESFTETTEAVKVLETESVTNTYKVVNEDGTTSEVSTTSEVPTKTEDRPPVLVDNVVGRNIEFAEQPMSFTYQEIVQAKKNYIENNSLNEVLFFSEDLNEADFSTDLSTHEADMGNGVIVVHGYGEVRTNKLLLGKTTDTFDIYFEGVREDITIEVGATTTSYVTVPADGLVTLPSATSEVYVKFSNTSDKKREIHAFGILG